MGAHSVSDDDIKKAAIEAEANFIFDLEKKFDTYVGNKG